MAERLKKAYSAKDTTLYDRLGKLFQAMDKGDPVLNVPTYNGGPFACCLCFAPDGRTLATGNVDSTVLIWDLALSRPKR